MKNIDKITIIKVIATAVGGSLSSILGVLYIPVKLLVVCNIADYITGLMAAPSRDDGKVSSYKSIRGIFKKIAMWILIVVGAVVDELLMYTTSPFGIQGEVSYLIAAAVAVWLSCNELISILENVKDIGIKIPKGLLPLVKNVAKKTEDSITEKAVKGDDQDDEDERN